MQQPTIFISHGAPSFALETGKASALLTQLGATVNASSGAKAVLVVSPHWMTRTLTVMTTAAPQTLYDFGGFDPRLNLLHYRAPGHPTLAQATVDLLRKHGYDVATDAQRGFDHGAWVPLVHLLPKADLPVFQLSLPHQFSPADAHALGRALRPLSQQGVVILGSGSLTHNLSELQMHPTADAQYATEFAAWARGNVVTHNHVALVNMPTVAPHAKRAHPTIEHYLPLLVAAGAAADSTTVEVLDGGISYGVISMESYVWRAV